MPMYEFVCGECDQSFDKVMRFSELDQQPICPTCGSPDTRKKISLFASSGSASQGSSGGCGPSSGSRFR